MERSNREESGVHRVPGPENVAGAYHDVLSALAAIIINVELLADAAGDGEAARDSAEDARACVDRAAKIIRALQAEARGTAASPLDACQRMVVAGST
jgi:hypothetical protein